MKFFDHPFDRFADRTAAGEMLASHLQEYRGRNPLVLAIPRGAVPLAKVIADRLDGELDVVLAHKFGAPFDPEYALGAVDETGWAYLTPYTETNEAGRSFIEEEKAVQIAMLRRRREQYTPHRPPVDPKDRIVIVVDDGIATGATMIAALHAVRSRGPAELICAAPVGAAESIALITDAADKVVCPHAIEDLDSIGRFYRDFRQVEDDEVIRILAEAGAKQHPSS